MRLFTGSILALVLMSAVARAEDLVLYGAGSLREVIGQIATEFGAAHGLTVKTQFGPSGRMRERIERGEHVDLFTSADVGHARKLVQDGRASLMTVFVRNTVCVLSPAATAMPACCPTRRWSSSRPSCAWARNMGSRCSRTPIRPQPSWP